MALADRVSMPVERADFDDLVTLVTQAPTWEKDRLPGHPRPAARDRRGQGDAPEQILARWTWRLARASRKAQDRRASAEFPEAKRLLGALANSRGHRHEENAARLVNAALEQPLQVGAALLASAEGYTPRANQLIDAARESLGSIDEVAWRSPRTCRAEGGAEQARRRRRKRKGGAGGPRREAQPAEGGGAAEAPVEPTGRRRRREAPAEATAERRAARPRARTPDVEGRRPTSPDGSVLVLLGIGFAAGLITALSPCVLPVLPIVLAGSARRAAPTVRDRRRPRLELHGLHARGRRAARRAGPPGGLPAQPRDRAPLPRRRDAASRPRRPPRRAPVPLVLTRRRPRRCGRLRPRARPRARLRAVRGPVLAAIDGRRGERLGCERRRGDARVRAGARMPMLAIAIGGQRVAAPLARADAEAPPVLGGVVAVTALAIAFGVDRRFQTWIPGYVESVQERDRAQRRRRARTRATARRRRGATGARRARRLRPGARVRRDLALAELAAADARGAARQGRRDRLLDVLVHQLPAHAAVPEGLGRAYRATG